MGPADLTLVKLNSALGGVGTEWGSDQGPAGAALPVEIRSKARELGNVGQPAAAAELLLKSASKAGAAIPAALLDEIDQNIAPTAQDPAVLRALTASLRNTSASRNQGPEGKKSGLFSRLFGRK